MKNRIALPKFREKNRVESFVEKHFEIFPWRIKLFKIQAQGIADAQLLGESLSFGTGQWNHL